MSPQGAWLGPHGAEAAAGVDVTAADEDDEAGMGEELGGGFADVERGGCVGRFSTQHLIEDSEQDTLSKTWNLILIVLNVHFLPKEI